MKLYLLFWLVCIASVLSGCSKSQNKSIKTSLKATEFSEKISQISDAVIIDVRTPHEFENGHLQNARNFNWSGEGFDYQIGQLDKAKPVFVYCQVGGRSSGAARAMRASGFKEVYELDGGIMTWRAANLPETRLVAFAGMSRQQFDSLLNSDKPVLVDFYAEWCAPCQKMKPYLDEMAITMTNKISLIRINADDHQSLMRELNIDALPVMQLYKNKVLVWSHNGFIDKEGLLKKLQ